MTGWSSDPPIEDETLKILGDLERKITENSGKAKDILKAEFSLLKQKITEIESEKFDYVERLEKEQKTAISNIRSKFDGLKMAQKYAGKGNPEITEKFREMENDRNRLGNSIRNKDFTINRENEEFFEKLRQFCAVNYGIPDAVPPIQPVKPPQKAEPIIVPELQKAEPIIAPELHENASEPKIHALPEKIEPIDNLVRIFRGFKMQQVKFSLLSKFPDEIMSEAKKYIVVENKYSTANFYEIILNSLKDSKFLRNIRIGFESFTRLAFCIYLDRQSEEIAIIKVLVALNKSLIFLEKSVRNSPYSLSSSLGL